MDKLIDTYKLINTYIKIATIATMQQHNRYVYQDIENFTNNMDNKKQIMFVIVAFSIAIKLSD